SGLVGSDLMGILKPKMEAKKRMTWGYFALGGGGLIAILLAFNPPAFLVTSILWAFGLLATAVSPSLLLGVWWKQANKYAMIISSVACGIIYIVISPHVIKGVVVGQGLVAALGMSGAMVTVPLAFVSFILLSVIFNKMNIAAPSLADMQYIDRIHGWGDDYDEKRYNNSIMPLMIVVVSVIVFIWGLQPW
ncbi:MAG: sodium:solute symporter, partial [Desulfatitalea sp.]|nr:sodium:solute symporter [Desulfatitalea sp.]